MDTATRLGAVLAAPRKAPQSRSRKVRAKGDGVRHGEPPVLTTVNHINAASGNPSRESPAMRVGMTSCFDPTLSRHGHRWGSVMVRRNVEQAVDQSNQMRRRLYIAGLLSLLSNLNQMVAEHQRADLRRLRPMEEF